MNKKTLDMNQDKVKLNRAEAAVKKDASVPKMAAVENAKRELLASTQKLASIKDQIEVHLKRV